ncbi:MAG: transposase [Pirellula sp.]
MCQLDYYRPDNTNVAYALRWSWTGWPSTGSFPSLDSSEWELLKSRWENDGVRLLERRSDADQWQIIVSTKPNVVPSMIVARLKGRIDHAFRAKKLPFQFSRKVSLRSIGNNTENDVQNYIRNQVIAAEFCDEKYAEQLSAFTRHWEDDQWSKELEVSSGRYWYQLHLVFVVEDRHRIRSLQFLGELFEQVQAISLDRGYRLAALSVMPDHLHVGLRGVVAESPESIALALMNETCQRMKVNPIWRPSFYAGTTGAYNMNAVRG